MPQYHNQLFPRRAHRKPMPAFEAWVGSNLDLIYESLQRIQGRLTAKQPAPSHRTRGKTITRLHERAVQDLIATGVSRAQAAREVGISRTAVSLLAAGKHPFGAGA